MHAPLSRLTDPTSPVYGAASAAAFGALSLVDPAQLSPRGRLALKLASAVTHGVTAGVSVEPDAPPVPAKLFTGVLAGTAGWVLAAPSWALERRMATWLGSHGVKHPRRWLAGTAALAGLAMHVAERAAAKAAPADEDAQDADPGVSTRPLAADAREVVRAVLTAAETADAAVLLTQLDTAEEVVWAEEDESLPVGLTLAPLEVRVADDAPLVVPHSQLYPVRARFEDASGTELEVGVAIEGGRLSGVTVARADGRYDEHLEESREPWPDPARLRFVRESPQGGVVPM